MKLSIVALALAAASTSATAGESCALRVARLLASGDADALARHFVSSDSMLLPALQRLAQRLGPIEGLAEAERPTLPKSTRVSVRAPGQPASFDYVGQWVDARATAVGPVQIHVAITPGSECRLIALHVDQPVP